LSEAAERVLTGAQMVVEGLGREGVDVVFGHPGGAILPLYDALYGSAVRHILMRHEQGAAHAADGFTRASGRPGVCVATSGPGATNLITGLASAHMDSIGVVAITGQVGLSMLGTDAFQEADTLGMTLPVVKHSYLVKDTGDIPRVLREAFYLASTGRPGPVLVDLPKDVQAGRAPVRWPEGSPRVRGYQPSPPVSRDDVRRAAEAILAAKRPLLMVGGGVVKSGAAAEVVALATQLEAPVISTLMGLGAFPGDHPQHLGMMGMHGTPIANVATLQCDVLVGLGVRFDDRVTGDTKRFAPQAKVIHFDIDRAEISKNVTADVAVVGDCRASLTLLLAELKGLRPAKRWAPEMAEHHRPDADRVHGYPEDEVPEGHISGPDAVRALHRATGGGAVVVTDVGQHQMWAAQHYHLAEPHRFITSGGLGAMGFGLPAAIGAQVARPNDLVLCLTGDGSLQMTVQELATVAAYQLPLKIAVFDNGHLGMVRQWQEMFYQQRYSSSELWNPDFVKLAEAYGIAGFRASTHAELDAAVDRALATPGPALIDIRQSAEELTLPIVPAGKALEDMIIRPA
jgi:acetolactate synthase-1/2/3 large subunit